LPTILHAESSTFVHLEPPTFARRIFSIFHAESSVFATPNLRPFTPRTFYLVFAAGNFAHDTRDIQHFARQIFSLFHTESSAFSHAESSAFGTLNLRPFAPRTFYLVLHQTYHDYHNIPTNTN
jgi:hypothetical protein